MAEIIELQEWLSIDPVLRKGDLVRLINMDEFTGSDYLENASGVVIEIRSVLPADHKHAPHQADHVDVALPFTDGWDILERVPIGYLHRILSSELRDPRK
jgi:hypothetical protein|tara:strand:- start:30 stop:329 length:300 start_codon:yes stop_codon:yes gene_type:complete